MFRNPTDKYFPSFSYLNSIYFYIYIMEEKKQQPQSCCGHHQLPEGYVPKHHKTVDETYDHFLISPDPLSLDKARSLVHNNAAGAISLFEGTTRDTFNGK